jgi:hypothetical protein
MLAGLLFGCLFISVLLYRHWTATTPQGEAAGSEYLAHAPGVVLLFASASAAVGAMLTFFYLSVVRPVVTAVVRGPEEFERQYGSQPAFRTEVIEKRVSAKSFSRDVASDAIGRGAVWGIVAGILFGCMFVLFLLYRDRTATNPVVGSQPLEFVFRVVVASAGACGIAGAMISFLYSSVVRPVVTALLRSPREFERQYGTHPAFPPHSGDAPKRRRWNL